MAFFSGQDLKTLQSEGSDTNCFVSLIVDTKGTYQAAITRKVQSKEEVIVRNIGTSYEFFGEGNHKLETTADPIRKEVGNVTIEYFMLNVNREVVDNPYDFLDKRFEDIEAKKITIHHPSPITYSNISLPPATETKELSLFSEDDESKRELTEWKPNPKAIHDAIIKMVLCSLNIKTEGVDLKQWAMRHMEKMYNRIFDASMTTDPFAAWCDFITEFIISNFSDENMPEEVYEDQYLRESIVASAMYNELLPYQDCNEYMQAYLEKLDSFIIQ